LKKKKIRILFRTAGGAAPKKELGMGHIYRSLNLAENLKGNKIFFIIADYGQAEKIIRKKGYKEIIIFNKGISIKSDITKTLNFIKEKKIDLVIVDKYNVTKNYLSKIKKHTKIVLISDLTRVDYPVDLLINGFIGFKNEISTNKFDEKCLLGPKYQILNNKFSSRHYKKSKRDFDVLVTFGGFDEKNISLIILKAKAKFEKKIRLKIILGPATKQPKKMKYFLKKYQENVVVVNKTDDMCQEISNSKFGFCGGGITSYEFAAVGIPFAILCQTKHQLKTAKVWNKMGIAQNLGMAKNKTQKIVEKIINDIVKGKINKFTISSKVDGFGAKRVSREIIQLVSK